LQLTVIRKDTTLPNVVYIGVGTLLMYADL